MRSVRALALLGWLCVLGALLPAGAAALPRHFTDTTVFSGLSLPTAVDVAPGGRVFVAEKSGMVKVFDGLDDPTPTVFADLRTEVYNVGDRGLIGMRLDPNFPSRPYVYVSYTYDAPIGGAAPLWGAPGESNDPCPTPPGPTQDGCIASGRLARLTVDLGTGTMSSEKVLVNDWCQQFWSHTVGGIAFGADGSLYMSAGDGASYSFADYGQRGYPDPNPCGDPPSGYGGIQTPPTAEGGSLRAQDYRTSGDPLGLDGSLIRVNPDSGRPVPDMPGEDDESVLNQGRIVAYGFRNPFRIAVRPGTDEVWVGDVGWRNWEEIDRIRPGSSQPEDFGWPCVEGPSLHPQQWVDANVDICNDLYAEGGGSPPYFSYAHGAEIDPGESCDLALSSISGLEFYRRNPGPAAFPDSYDGGLFFSDYSRRCIWVMKADRSGLPDPDHVEIFAEGPGAVDLREAADGTLYYPAIAQGEIHRITYKPNKAPQPEIETSADPAGFSAGERITFSGSATDPEDGTIPGSRLSWRLVDAGCTDDPCAELPLDIAPSSTGGDFEAPSDPLSGGLRLELTAVDSEGRKTTTSRVIDPRLVHIALESRRPGAKVTAAGVKGRARLSLDVLRSSAMLISTPARQHANGYGKRSKLHWRSWSDGGGRIHYVSPKRDRTLIARYELKKKKKSRRR